jgi:glycolate oxidase FAD binding subunit
VRPATPQAVADALRAAREQGRRVRTLGAGTRASLRPPLPAGTLLLVTTALDAIVAHEPGDQTITVQAGLTLAALDAQLARHGQWLPVAAGRGGLGTVGGLLAAAVDGACDLQFGRARERLLGGALALPDGSVAHGRGRVVKNVAGYDLPRLLCGAHDTLGVLVEASFKVEPRPTLRAACVADFDGLPRAFAAARALLDSGLQPAFADVAVPAPAPTDAPGAAAQLAVGFCGSTARVEGQLAAWQDLLAPHGPHAVSELRGAPHDELVARLDAPAEACTPWGLAEAGSPGRERIEGAVLRLAVLPTALPELCADALALAARHEAVARLDARPGLGLLFAALHGEAGAVAASARALLERGRREGAARALAATSGARALLSVEDLWGPPPPELFLLERVKAACDPAGVLGAAWPAGSD